MSVLVDNSTYATVDRNDLTLQFTSTVTINIMSTPLNLFTFYLVLTQSKKEIIYFKMGLFLNQVTHFITILIWGLLAGFALLHPFPAIYCLGPLKDVMEGFTAFMIWMFSFELFYFTGLWIHTIRLKVICRPGKMFDLKNRTYWLIGLFLSIYIFVPMNFVVYLDYASEEDMFQFVSTYYPNNRKVFENRGVYVSIHEDVHQLFLKVLLFYLVTGPIITSFYTLSTAYEVHHQPHMHGSKAFEERKAITNQLAKNLLFTTFFMFIACMIIFSCVFRSPDADTRLVRVIGNTMFCGASIPGQLLLIHRTKSYRTRVLAIFSLRKKEVHPEDVKREHRPSVKSLSEVEESHRPALISRTL